MQDSFQHRDAHHYSGRQISYDPNLNGRRSRKIFLTSRNVSCTRASRRRRRINFYFHHKCHFVQPNVCAVRIHDVNVLSGHEILMTICALKIQTRRSCSSSWRQGTSTSDRSKVFSSQMFSIMPESPLFFVFLNHIE